MNRILTIAALILLTAPAHAADGNICGQLHAQKSEALQRHDVWARTIDVRNHGDGVASAGEMLIEEDFKEINNHFNYLLGVYGCYE